MYTFGNCPVLVLGECMGEHIKNGFATSHQMPYLQKFQESHTHPTPQTESSEKKYFFFLFLCFLIGNGVAMGMGCNYIKWMKWRVLRCVGWWGEGAGREKSASRLGLEVLDSC